MHNEFASFFYRNYSDSSNLKLQTYKTERRLYNTFKNSSFSKHILLAYAIINLAKN